MHLCTMNFLCVSYHMTTMPIVTCAVNYLSRNNGEESWESVGMRNRYCANSVKNYAERSATTRLIGQPMKRQDRCAESGRSRVSGWTFVSEVRGQERKNQRRKNSELNRQNRMQFPRCVTIDFTNSIAHDKKPAWLSVGLQGGIADWPRTE